LHAAGGQANGICFWLATTKLCRNKRLAHC
jgi:hypothetical protein